MKSSSSANGFLALIFVAWGAVSWSGCGHTQKNAPPPAAYVPYAADILREGDVIQILFPGDTNQNTVIKVPLDGVIKLQLAGEYTAVGKTTKQLQDEIMEKFGPQLRQKDVLVMRVTSSATVYVSGAVLAPGKVPLDRPLTVIEAIMEVGGFDQSRAKPDQVMIIRQDEGRQTTFTVDLKRSLRGQDAMPVYLRPSDVVHVPFKTFNL